MALDLIIFVQSDFSIDEKERNTYRVTEVFNVKNCWSILSQLDNELNNKLTSGATYTFVGKVFHKILKVLQTQLTRLTESIRLSEFEEVVKKGLEYDIRELERFIIENNVPDDDTQDYQVYAQW